MIRALLCLICLLAVVRAIQADEMLPDARRVQQVRAMYRKLPSDLLMLEEPVTLVDVTFTRIPLAAIVELKDAKGKSLFIRRDNGLKTTTPDAIYLSRKAAFKQESLLSTRGPEEDAVYGLLLRWQEQELKKPYDDRLDRWTMEDVEQFLLRFDMRYAGDPPVESPDSKP